MTKSDRAFVIIKDDWYHLPNPQRLYWIEKGRKIQHLDGSASSRSATPFESTNSPIPDSSASELRPRTEELFSLQELFSNSTPEILESAMDKGIQTLCELKSSLSRTKVEDASHCLAAVLDIQKKAEKLKQLLVVVGNTGAGKSSVINAILDEERLVPTNCMRTCTAVVTEISYNHIDDLYRAEIEFIVQQDWEKELNILFQDLLDSQGKISHDAINADTEAGVAYAKIRAVYPNYTREKLEECSVDDLINHENVQDVLGITKEVTASDSLLFYKQVQSFVDSKEKTTGDKNRDKTAAKKVEYWPLIKVVRLHVKAAPLSTGAVIVDLPGVHDSNAARSAIAEEYIKRCNGLWIVAPITRVVDDKAAKSLLSGSFKRQLKMDGGFNMVTFICSKTDNINVDWNFNTASAK
jgi:GTPase SAR1 family protein